MSQLYRADLRQARSIAHGRRVSGAAARASADPTADAAGMSLGLRAHHRVVDLIEDGARAGAEELWRKYLTEAREFLVRPDVTTVLDLTG
jgi:DNA-binding GntR family transcriptional regulator